MAVVIVLVLLVVGSVIFTFVSPYWFTPIASNWGTIDDILILTFILTGIVFVLVVLFMAWAIHKYRYDKNRRSAYEPENNKLEWWLTILTSIAVIAMLAPGLVVWNDFITVPEDAHEVDVLGQQWHWAFRYPGEDGVLGTSGVQHITFANPLGVNPDDPNGQDDILIATSQVMHLPMDRPVKILLRSKDVLHDFYVPQFRAKMDMIPGQVSYFWLTPIREGTFEILCAELCGVGHYQMRGKVVVEDEASYQTWLTTQPTFAETMSSGGVDAGVSLFDRGRLLAEGQGCLSCHSLDGSAGVGPTWQNIFGRSETMADGSVIVVDEAYLRESIINPNAKVVEGFDPFMPPYDLTDEELEAIIAFMRGEGE